MEIINWVGATRDTEVKDLVIHCAMCGFVYEQAKDMAEEKGYYLPEDQYLIINELLNSQMSLDIGNRQAEWKPDYVELDFDAEFIEVIEE